MPPKIKKTTDLLKKVRSISHGKTEIDLSNKLIGKSGLDVAEILALIPSHVTELDVSSNKLGNKSCSELTEAFSAIPVSVRALDLASNKLGNKSGAELYRIFAAIPSSVTTLKLCANELGSKYWPLLITAIPLGVKTLGLSDNVFNDKSELELVKIFANMLPNITTILLYDSYGCVKDGVKPKTKFLTLISNCSSFRILSNGQFKDDYPEKKVHTRKALNEVIAELSYHLGMRSTPQTLTTLKQGIWCDSKDHLENGANLQYTEVDSFVSNYVSQDAMIILEDIFFNEAILPLLVEIALHPDIEHITRFKLCEIFCNYSNLKDSERLSLKMAKSQGDQLDCLAKKIDSLEEKMENQSNQMKQLLAQNVELLSVIKRHTDVDVASETSAQNRVEPGLFCATKGK